MIDAEYHRNYYAQNREKILERKKARMARLVELGLCRRCGQRPRRPGRVHCMACAVRISNLRRAKIEQAGKGN